MGLLRVSLETRDLKIPLGLASKEDERDSGDVGLEPGLARGTLAGLLWGLKERVEGALVGQLAAPESADI